MALPTSDNIKSLSFSMNGSPWCKIAAKSGIVTDNLNLSKDGSPWWGIAIATTVVYRLKDYIGAAWVGKPLKIYIGGSWVTKSLKRFNGASWV